MKKIQKMFYYSSNEIKTIVETIIKEKSEITGISESKIIEDYIIGGIIRDFPQNENANKLLDKVKQRYQFIDKKFLDD